MRVLHKNDAARIEDELVHRHGRWEDTLTHPLRTDELDSESKFRVLVENSPDIIMTLDPEGTILFINYTLPHLTRKEVTGTSLLDYVSDTHRDRCEEVLTEVLETGEPHSFELSAEGPTWWLTRFIPIKQKQQIETVLVIATDISEQKRAEEALRESENKFRALAEMTTAAIFIFKRARMVYANPAAELITGYNQKEILGMDFWEFVHPDYRELVKTRGQARLDGADVPNRWEIKLETKSGETRWVDYGGSLLEFEGEPAVLGTAVDITERKEAEEEKRRLEAQVQHAQKLESLGVLAGGIAHDFNNLLTGILGSASLAAMKLPEGSPAEEQLQRILKAAEKAAELTNQMLAYAGKGRFVMGPVDLNELVREVIPLVRTSISKKTSLRESFAENLPMIDADQTQLQQVVMNLCTNASEALQDEEGEVLVRTGAIEAAGSPGAYVFLEVSDTGVGMDEKTKSKIFDPFFTTKFTGRGLGLAAVQGIVRAHKATIRVESQRHRGTMFTVLIPASSRRISPIIDDGPSRSGLEPTGGTILVIDDEESVRSVARQALEEAGFDVLLARDGHEAVDFFLERTGDIDAVLLDMSMPRMSGEETLKELRSLRPGVRVVMTSGYSEEEVSERFAGKGLAGFVQKPFRAGELVDKIQQAISP